MLKMIKKGDKILMNLIAVEASTDLCSVASFKDGILQNVIDLVETKSILKTCPTLFHNV